MSKLLKIILMIIFAVLLINFIADGDGSIKEKAESAFTSAVDTVKTWVTEWKSENPEIDEKINSYIGTEESKELMGIMGGLAE